MLLPIVVVQVTNKKNDSAKVTNGNGDTGNGGGNGNDNGNDTSNVDSSTFTSSSSSSLMKILLRIDVLQSTLITCLFSKLQELATMDQDDDDDNDDDNDDDDNDDDDNDDDDNDDNDNNKNEDKTDKNDNKKGKNKSATITKATTTLDIDYLAIIQEIPRLILSHIRWMDHIVQPKVLTQAALECLTMLCTMSGSTISDDDDGDGDGDDGDNIHGNGIKNNRNGNRNTNNRTKNDTNNTDNNTICKSILLDLIATLPDIIADETTAFDSTVIGTGTTTGISREDNHDDEEEEEEEDTMTTILSTLRDVRIQDPTLLIPCLDAVSSLRLSTQDQMDSVIYDALEAIESVEESWLLPALCKFLMQNVPRGGSGGVFGSGGGSGGSGTKGSDLCQKVIDSFRRLRLGKENVIDNDEDMDGLEYRNQIQCNSDSEALMIEALSQGFAYRSDLTNILLQSIKNVLSGSITTSTADQLQHQQHGPSDIWLLLCCAQAPHNKPKVKAIFKSKAISGAFYPDLIKDSIQGNTIAIQSLFESSLLFIADALVRSNETSAQKLGSAFYETMFLEFDNRICRQDLIGQMIIHINSGSYEEVDVAMKILMNIASSGVDGVASLRIFLPFLTSLLDNIRNFHPQHLRRLFLLLFIVGMDGSCGSEDVDSEMEGFGGGGGCDDVHIVIRKYLALPQITMKHIVSDRAIVVHR
jgi:hypothetical protein